VNKAFAKFKVADGLYKQTGDTIVFEVSIINLNVLRLKQVKTGTKTVRFFGNLVFECSVIQMNASTILNYKDILKLRRAGDCCSCLKN